MNVERLERMAKLLRDDAANPKGVQFDLGSWAEPADAVDTGSWTTETLPEKVAVDCGTKACAFGLAAISGEFAKEGLIAFYSERYELRAGVHMLAMIPMLNREQNADGTPSLRNPDGFGAAEHLFDISNSDACYFFDPECYYGTPTEAAGEILVAERIEAFINGDIDRNYHPDTSDDIEEEDDENDFDEDEAIEDETIAASEEPDED